MLEGESMKKIAIAFPMFHCPLNLKWQFKLRRLKKVGNEKNKAFVTRAKFEKCLSNS